MIEDDVKVTCSCGKTTMVRFSRKALGRDGTPWGRYIADDSSWRFRLTAEADAENKRNGWYCGKPGHEQAKP